MAIAVPKQINGNYSFTAPSFGVRASCAAFTSNCTLQNGSNIAGVHNCTSAGYPDLPFFISATEGPGTNPNWPDNGIVLAHVGNLSMIGVGGGADLPHAMESSSVPYPNPVPMTLQLTWSTLSGGAAAGHFPPSCDAVGPWQSSTVLDGQVVLSACNLTWYNITIQQTKGLYVLLEEELSNPAFASVLWSPLVYQYATMHLENYLQSIAMSQNNTDTLMDILGAELARQAMSMAAATFQPADTTSQATVGTKLLGRYPLAPVITMLVLLASSTIIFLVLAVWIVASSSSPVVETATNGDERPTVLELTQLRLTTPLALAAQLFAENPESSFQPGFVEMFEAEDTRTAVGIGLVERDGKQWFEVHNVLAELSKDEGTKRSNLDVGTHGV
ncbi:hypothetical protein CALCODRAFT_519806 [Calocera cornea HHB12733]|uniref:Uncharacterized protein n=1 Tax=Calocera cornea HHB12733 TaxID=1353952 RepID=A0A165DZH9_9BASI|nr:hypothetical protein CALCODRAFT_519806 [Calocera cornea HHB12733]